MVVDRNSADPLSDVLASIRLDGAVFLEAELTAPWAMRGRYGAASVRQRLAGAGHVILFHFFTEGRCKVRLAEGGETVEVAAGDLVLFPRDDRHLIGSDLAYAPLEAETIRDWDEPRGMMRLRHGGGGAATRFVCGYLSCSRELVRPMLEALPALVRIPAGEGGSMALVHALLAEAVRESALGRPGSQSMLARLAELIFVEALRRYVESLPEGRRGWLAGLRDPGVGRALARLHGEPERRWSVDGLAREVALSRSALAERFTAMVGESPMQYLTRLRLCLAARALRGGTEAIARVARRSGYDSEAAFNRAFKREYGLPPAAWRRAALKRSGRTATPAAP